MRRAKEHETHKIQWGGYIRKNWRSPGSWTKNNIENSLHTIYFHARDITEQDKSSIENAFEEFILPVNARLNKIKPQPYFNHPYWIGAIAAFHKQSALLKDTEEYDYMDSAVNDDTPLEKWTYSIYGVPPNVFPWHPRWNEYQNVKHILREFITGEEKQNVAFFYDSYRIAFMSYCHWVKKDLGITQNYYIRNFQHANAKLQELEKNPLGLCVLMIATSDFKHIKNDLALIKRILKKDGKLLIFIPNEKYYLARHIHNFQVEVAHKIDNIITSGFQIVHVKSINDNWTLRGGQLSQRIKNIPKENKIRKMLCHVFFGLPLAVICLIRNSLLGSRNQNEGGHCTNIVLSLVPEKMAGE